jgi:hypothetical protein
VSIVLISNAQHLDGLKALDVYREAQTFSEAEALRALETITRTKPPLVVLERTFAETTRGAALINRIKADSKLSGCRVRIVDADGTHEPEPEEPSAPEAPAVEVVAPSVPVVAPLDQRGTRRAPRVRIVEGVEVIIDGDPATLIDLSIVGAQVVSPTILKPNQRVRMSIPDGRRTMRLAAGVAWASFELAKTGPHYRAGIEFFDADPEPLRKFCDARKKA